MTKTFRSSALYLLSALLFFVSVSVASADIVLRTGETVSIAEEQVVEGNFYGAAGKVNISGTVSEDIVIAAGQVTLNGSVGEGAFIVAGQVEVHGTVGNDLRIVAGDVTIADPVMGDLFVLGGTVHILSTASIAGDVLLFAGEATIEGSVGGDVMGTVRTLRLDAPIAGDVDVTTDKLVLGDRSNVAGSVRYVSEQVVEQSLNATVGGDMVRSDPVLPGTQPSAQAALIPLLILLFSVGVWFLVSRRSLGIVADRALTKRVRPALLGVTVLFLAPFAFSLLFLSMVGTLVSLVIIFGYLLFITLSLIAAPAVMGRLLLNIFNQREKQVTLLTLVVGVVAIALLMLLPVIGQVVLFILITVTFGTLFDLLLKPHRPEDTI